MKLGYILLILLCLTSCQSSTRAVGTDTSLNSYQLVLNWPSLPDEIKLGKVSGVDVNSKGRVYIIHRGVSSYTSESPILKEDVVIGLDNETGRVIDKWGAGLFSVPHGLTVDPEDNIWITDVVLHQVFKFSPGGELLLSLGEAGVPGDDDEHFNGPTDVAFLTSGDFLVSDGYGNHRILKYSADGSRADIWTNPGNAEQTISFNLPHSVFVDKQDRIYVADILGKRVSILDRDGNLLKTWTNPDFGVPYAFKQIDGKLIIVEGISPGGRGLPPEYRSAIHEINGEGEIVSSFGEYGEDIGKLMTPHDVASDDSGDIYVAEANGQRAQKFTLQRR